MEYIFMTVFLAAGSLYAGVELGDPLFGVGMAGAAVEALETLLGGAPEAGKGGQDHSWGLLCHRAIRGGRAADPPGRLRCDMHRSYQRFPRHLPKREAEIGGGFGTEHREYTVGHGKPPP